MRTLLVLLLVASCEVDRGEPSSDARANPDVSACCWEIVRGREAVETCIASQLDEGECWWLTCLGGLVEYTACGE